MTERCIGPFMECLLWIHFCFCHKSDVFCLHSVQCNIMKYTSLLGKYPVLWWEQHWSCWWAYNVFCRNKHLFLHLSFLFPLYCKGHLNQEQLTDEFYTLIFQGLPPPYSSVFWDLSMWSRMVGWDGGYTHGSAFQSSCIMWMWAFSAPFDKV